MSFVVGGGWSLPPGYPNFSMTWIEMVGTEGALFVDDTPSRRRAEHHEERACVLPMSTMPGEFVEHTYAGPMAAETVHFLEAVACDRPVLVTPEQARMVMEVYIAADLSAERNEPVNLPLPESRPAQLAAGGCAVRKQPKRIGLAIVGAGRVGLIRGELAARHPEVEWIGIAEKNPERAQARRRQGRRGFRHRGLSRAARAPRSQCGDHLHRRAPARRPDPRGAASAGCRC